MRRGRKCHVIIQMILLRQWNTKGGTVHNHDSHTTWKLNARSNHLGRRLGPKACLPRSRRIQSFPTHLVTEIKDTFKSLPVAPPSVHKQYATPEAARTRLLDNISIYQHIQIETCLKFWHDYRLTPLLSNCRKARALQSLQNISNPKITKCTHYQKSKINMLKYSQLQIHLLKKFAHHLFKCTCLSTQANLISFI